MTRLASPIANIKAHYAVVVVGSGYGGGIAASRLARAGQTVCVLERGKEFQPGEYPNKPSDVLRETQTDAPALHVGPQTGLFDFRVNNDLNVFVGCGLGGTSLINANVALHPDPRVFDDPIWPQAFRDDAENGLSVGFARAREMLRPETYPADHPSLPKMEALQKAAGAMGASFSRLPINVTFEDGLNPVGVEQRKCVMCGDCVSGCNYSAKNTVLMNYLPDAHNHGAEIYTEVAVRRLEKGDRGWIIHYQLLQAGSERCDAPMAQLNADIVILAVGTLGSTEILLRSRNAGLSISNRLGERFSGNGDLIGFGYNGNVSVNGIGFGDAVPDGRTPVGPSITSIISVVDNTDLSRSFVIEEVGIPGGVGGFVPTLLATAAALENGDEGFDPKVIAERKARELESLVYGPYTGAVQNTQTYLVMVHDNAGGRLVLENDRLRVHWPGVADLPNFEIAMKQLARGSESLEQISVPNPKWTNLSKHGLTTVHPLGGCVMAETADGGVVNHKGQVFTGTTDSVTYEDLYVCDGGVIPRSLGVNPSLTISAIAERCCALIAQNRGWHIDYSFQNESAPPATSERPD